MTRNSAGALAAGKGGVWPIENSGGWELKVAEPGWLINTRSDRLMLTKGGLASSATRVPGNLGWVAVRRKSVETLGSAALTSGAGSDSAYFPLTWERQ